MIGPSIIGLPVVAMPAGFEGRGLPASLKFIERPRSYFAVLKFAAALESARPDLRTTRLIQGTLP